MKVFEINISGSTDSNDDGRPDVSAKVTIFAVTIIDLTQDLSFQLALELFGSVTDTVRKTFGIK